jgi:hypothetical protein
MRDIGYSFGLDITIDFNQLLWLILITQFH